MKAYLTSEILLVLNIVYHYRRYKQELRELNRDCLIDWYTDTEIFYYGLSLPEGLNKNRVDFEQVIRFDPLHEPYKTWNDMEEEELNKIVWKNN